MCFRLFEQYPDTKGAFSPFKSINSSDARYEKELREHGIRVLHTVQNVLDVFPDEKMIIQNLHELGQKHVMFSAKADYIDVGI